MSRLSPGDLARVNARLLFLQASLHRRGMQNIGLLFALDAAADKLGRDRLLERHTDYFNTNPNLAPIVVGGILRIEEEGDSAGPASVSRFKQAAASALAAAGDVLFSGALRPLALTLACLSVIYSFFAGLLAVWVLYNTALLVGRRRGIAFGYARGWGLVESFSGPRVQRWLAGARGLAALGAGLLAGLLVNKSSAAGTYTVITLVGVAALIWLLTRRGMTAPRLALALFPLAWVIALLLP